LDKEKVLKGIKNFPRRIGPLFIWPRSLNFKGAGKFLDRAKKWSPKGQIVLKLTHFGKEEAWDYLFGQRFLNQIA